ncbi:MAG: thioredoxin family protein [Planctomycetota bacterium]
MIEKKMFTILRSGGSSRRRRYAGLISFLVVLFVSPAFAFQSESPDDHLVVDDGRVEYRIHFEILTPDGEPATEFAAWLKGGFLSEVQPCEIEGNIATATFDPVFRAGFIPELVIRTTDGQLGKNFPLSYRDLRNWSLQGASVTLEPMRQIHYRVLNEDESPAAGVTVHVDGWELETDDEGMASLTIPSEAILVRFVNARAVAPDGRAGVLQGYDMSEEDLKADTHEIVLQQGVQQTIRVKSSEGAAAQGVLISPQTMSRDIQCVPHRGYPCYTDAQGEVVVTFVPEPPGARGQIFVSDSNWSVNEQSREDDVWAVELSEVDRIKISGKVELDEGVAGGFPVRLVSFDHPAEGRVDQLTAFCDGEGNFSAEVMRNAVYGIQIDDSRYVSNLVSGVLADADGPTDLDISLQLKPAVPVTITFSAGPAKRPVEGTPIYLRQSREFQTASSGLGSAGNQWYAITDENGEAKTMAGVGELVAAIYENDFNAQETIEVVNDGDNLIRIHRENVAPVQINGRLTVVSDGRTAIDATVHVVASDNNYDFSETIRCEPSGAFSMGATGERFAIFAMTNDGALAGSAFVGFRDAEDFEISLVETTTYSGIAYDYDGSPLANRQFKIDVMMEDPDASETDFSRASKVMKSLLASTDADGRFHFENVPASMVLRINLVSTDINEIDFVAREIFISPEDVSRPEDVYQLGSTGREQQRLSPLERVGRLTQFATYSDTRALILIVADEAVAETVRRQVVSNHEMDLIYWYQPIVLSPADLEGSHDEVLLSERGWEMPAGTSFRLIAIGPDGNDIGTAVVDSEDEMLSVNVHRFLNEHRIEQRDARMKFDDALAEAKATERKVWAVVGGPRCYPCILLAEWMEEHKAILEKDFVIVKIDGQRDLNGTELKDLITSGKPGGIPFHAVFSSEGELLIDSESPIGNIGFPRGSREGALHLEEMLTEGGTNLSDSEIEAIIASLNEN